MSFHLSFVNSAVFLFFCLLYLLSFRVALSFLSLWSTLGVGTDRCHCLQVRLRNITRMAIMVTLMKPHWATQAPNILSTKRTRSLNLMKFIPKSLSRSVRGRRQARSSYFTTFSSWPTFPVSLAFTQSTIARVRHQ